MERDETASIEVSGLVKTYRGKRGEPDKEAVRGIDPETGHYFDDTKRYIDALAIPPDDKAKVFEKNARRVYPRLDAILKARGL